MRHRHTTGLIASAAAAVALLGACGSSAKSSSSAATQASRTPAAAATAAAAAGDGSGKIGVGAVDPQAASPTGQPTGVPNVPDAARALIVTAELKLRADDVGDAVNAVTAIAVQQGGNVYNSQVQLDKPARASVQVRVPPFKLADTETMIGKLGTVTGLTQQVQDVTEAAADLDARIKTAQASVDRVRGFLDKATSLSDLASLEAQVTQRETTLEQLQAQQRMMADQTGLSTLTVDIIGPDDVAAKPAHHRPSIVSGFKGGLNAFVAFVTVLALIIAAVLPFAVLGAIIVVPAWWQWKRWRRSHPVSTGASSARSAARPGQGTQRATVSGPPEHVHAGAGAAQQPGRSDLPPPI